MHVHPVTRTLRQQGRTRTWLAAQLGISANYYDRIVLGPEHPHGRPAPEWFYSRVAAILGVPETFLRPDPAEVAA